MKQPDRTVSQHEGKMNYLKLQKQLRVPYDLVVYVHENGKTPSRKTSQQVESQHQRMQPLMMQLGAEGVFARTQDLQSGTQPNGAAAIVQAVTNFTDAKRIAELSKDLWGKQW